MKKLFYFLTFALFLGIASPTYAVCPVCTVAVGVGLGFSRWLGIDDTVTGIWIGALIVSLIIWTINWFDKKQIKFFGRNLLTVLAYYTLIVLPLDWAGIIGHPLNTLWGIDKLTLSITIGSVVFFVGVWLYEFMKKKNNGHAHFPFEKIVVPVGLVAAFSILFYFITR